MKFSRRRRIESHIDMTPMIDTLLQLFVVFLLSMSFASSSVRLDLPRASALQAAPDEPLAVSLDAQNQLYLNMDAIQPRELHGRLLAAFREGKKRQVLLRAERKLEYEKILAVLVEIQRAGASNVLLAYDGGSDR